MNIHFAKYTVADLLKQPPPHYGLRGDINLWEELVEELNIVPLPENEDKLVTIIKDTIQALTGRGIDECDVFFVERYNTGGMSSGCVAPEFWLNSGIPLIVARFRKINNSMTYKLYKLFK